MIRFSDEKKIKFSKKEVQVYSTNLKCNIGHIEKHKPTGEWCFQASLSNVITSGALDVISFKLKKMNN